MSRQEVKSFEDLEVWQLGKQLTVLIYKLTESFPDREIYGIANQMRRAGFSVPANVAEGFGRFHYLDRVRFFFNARGSLNEVKSGLLISGELGLLNHAAIEQGLKLIELLSVKLNNLISTTKKGGKKGKGE